MILSVIPRSGKQFMSVIYGCVKFLDSIRFQQASLESLSESLNEEDFIQIKKLLFIGLYYRRK